MDNFQKKRIQPQITILLITFKHKINHFQNFNYSIILLLLLIPDIYKFLKGRFIKISFNAKHTIFRK